MLPSRSLLPTNHLGTDCSACCCSGPYFPPTTSEPTAQHVAVAVTIARINHFGTDCSACCRRCPYFPPITSGPTAAVAVPTYHQPLRNRLLSMLPSRSLLPTNHFGTDRSACCRRGPYFLPTTSEPTAQHVAVAVPTSHQPLRNRPLSMLPSRSLLPTNHFGTECSACCRRGPYFPPTTSEPSAQHVAVAVPTSHQPLRNRLLSMLPSRSLLPTNHFGSDSTACCRRGPYSHQPLRRGPYFSPTTSEPTAQHVAVAVPTSHQPLRNRLHSMLPSQSLLPPTTSSRSLFLTNHFGIDCSACCCRGPYFPPTTSEPTAQHVAVAVPTSHQPHRNRLLSMLLSRSLLPTNHFGTDCSACCRRGPYFPPITSGPTAQHVAVAVPTSHQPLRNRVLSMLPPRSLLPTNHFGTDCSACCRRGPYFPPTTSEATPQHVAVAVPTPTNHFVAVPISHQPLRNRLLSMLLSRSLLPTNHFGTDSTACCRRSPYSHQPLRRGPYFSPPNPLVAEFLTNHSTAQHVAVAVPTSHQPLRNRLLSMLLSRSLLPTNHIGTDCSACCCRGPYFPPTTSEPTAQHVAVAVPTPTNHFGTDCSARCPRGPYFPPTTSSRSLFHTNHFGTDCSACFRRGPYSHQPLRNRLLSMLPSRSLLPPSTSSRSLFHPNHFGTDCSLSRSLLPTNHFGTDCSACCRRGPYSSHQPLRNRLLSMLPSRSLLPTNHFVAVPISHQPLRNRLLSMFPSRSLLPTNHFGTDRSACCLRGPYFPPAT